MVTGIEAAGLALAILPLIVNQADNYVQGLETLKTFRSRRYRRNMESYYNSLSTQRTILENVLERCFQGVVEYEEDISELINNPSGPLWHDPTLQNMLSKKLGRNFDNFIRTVTELAGLLEEFSKKLGLSAEEMKVSVLSVPRWHSIEEIDSDTISMIDTRNAMERFICDRARDQEDQRYTLKIYLCRLYRQDQKCQCNASNARGTVRISRKHFAKAKITKKTGTEYQNRTENRTQFI